MGKTARANRPIVQWKFCGKTQMVVEMRTHNAQFNGLP